MHKDIKGLLGIQGWVVYGVREESGRIVVKVVVDPFHVIQDANHRLDEARRLEQEMSHRANELPRSKLRGIRREMLRVAQHDPFDKTQGHGEGNRTMTD